MGPMKCQAQFAWGFLVFDQLLLGTLLATLNCQAKQISFQASFDACVGSLVLSL